MLYQEIYNRIVRKIIKWDIENFYIVAIKQDKVIGIKKMGIQTIHSISVNPYKIEQYLTQREADKYILVHNHPNNNLSASYADVCSTNFFKQVIPFTCIGSMIITKNNYSFIPTIWEEDK